jgi:hypothetical protein
VRTRDERVEPPEHLRIESSPARVKGGRHVFRECHQWHDYSSPFLPVPFQSALHQAGRLLRQSTMLITGASGLAAGYNLVKRLVNYFVKIMILLVCINSMINMFYLRDNFCHVLLVSTMIFFMMIIWLNKHMYDVMITLVTLFFMD